MRFVLLVVCFLIPGLALAQSDRNDLYGEVFYHTVRSGDNLVDLSRHYNVGFVELRAANQGVDTWAPAPGTQLLIPKAHLIPDAPRKGIVINIPEMRLYHFLDNGRVATYPIGIGKEGRRTPLGTTTIVSRKENPTWTPPASIRREKPHLPGVVPPGPDNPLGRHALYLGWPAYLLHGTNLPPGVGRRVSAGCIRMYPEDIATLFRTAPNGTQVRVIEQPVKLGWSKGELYLQVHASDRQIDEIEETGFFTPTAVPGIEAKVRAAAGSRADEVDWDTVAFAATNRLAVPIRVTNTGNATASAPRVIRNPGVITPASTIDTSGFEPDATVITRSPSDRVRVVEEEGILVPLAIAENPRMENRAPVIEYRRVNQYETPVYSAPAPVYPLYDGEPYAMGYPVEVDTSTFEYVVE